MKKTCLAVIITAVLLSACDNSVEPMRELPPEPTTVKTSSTYTGTTVDFIYMSTAPQPIRGRNEFDMPEFPDLNNVDNPFDENFYGMFSDRNYYSYQFPVSSSESSAVSDVLTNEQYGSETSVPVERIFEDNMQTVTVSSVLPEAETEQVTTTVSSMDTGSVYQTAESFDIYDYMPDSNDYPAFTTVDIKSYFN